MSPAALNRFCKSVAASTFLLIVAGGLVTSTGSGLSVPDWPLSYGQFFPPMVGGIRFEHTHRVIAGIVALMTAVMAVLLWRYERREWVRILGFIALSAVLLQALLGGLTVIFLLPDWISIAHACLGQTFFSLVVAIAWITAPSWSPEGFRVLSRTETLSFRRLAFMTTTFIYAQLVAGAVLRHAQKGVTVHVILAFLVVLHIFLLVRKNPSRHTFFMALVVFAQFFLGIGSYIFKWSLPPAEYPRTAEVLFTAAHQSNGALLLAASVILSIKAACAAKAAS